MECPACAESSPEGATWCEACGQDLNAEPVPACESCGEREVTEEGYCGVCGHKQPEERDHMEFGEGSLIAVTNKGKRHRHNEDAAAVGYGLDAQGDVIAAALVVCDGVSSTPGSDQASEAAANAALEVLISGLADPDRLTNREDPIESDVANEVANEVETEVASEVASEPLTAVEELLVSATAAAQSKAAAAPEIESNYPGSSGGPPSSTFVAILAEPDDDGVHVTVGWLGDSRAYWLGDETLQLTEDHEIEGSLTRWIGADSPDPTPDTASFRFEGLGYLIACSDGLWRYAPTAHELKDLVQRLVDQGASGTVLGSKLIDFANENGGHDNITAAVWTNHPQPEPQVETESPESDDEIQPSEASASTDSESTDSDGTDSDGTDSDGTDSDGTGSDRTDSDEEIVTEIS